MILPMPLLMQVERDERVSPGAGTGMSGATSPGGHWKRRHDTCKCCVSLSTTIHSMTLRPYTAVFSTSRFFLHGGRSECPHYRAGQA